MQFKEGFLFVKSLEILVCMHFLLAEKRHLKYMGLIRFSEKSMLTSFNTCFKVLAYKELKG